MRHDKEIVESSKKEIEILGKFLREALVANPSQRPTIDQLRTEEWLQDMS